MGYLSHVEMFSEEGAFKDPTAAPTDAGYYTSHWYRVVYEFDDGDGLQEYSTFIRVNLPPAAVMTGKVNLAVFVAGGLGTGLVCEEIDSGQDVWNDTAITGSGHRAQAAGYLAAAIDLAHPDFESTGRTLSPMVTMVYNNPGMPPADEDPGTCADVRINADQDHVQPEHMVNRHAMKALMAAVSAPDASPFEVFWVAEPGMDPRVFFADLYDLTDRATFIRFPDLDASTYNFQYVDRKPTLAELEVDCIRWMIDRLAAFEACGVGPVEELEACAAACAQGCCDEEEYDERVTCLFCCIDAAASGDPYSQARLADWVADETDYAREGHMCGYDLCVADCVATWCDDRDSRRECLRQCADWYCENASRPIACASTRLSALRADPSGLWSRELLSDCFDLRECLDRCVLRGMTDCGPDGVFTREELGRCMFSCVEQACEDLSGWDRWACEVAGSLLASSGWWAGMPGDLGCSDPSEFLSDLASLCGSESVDATNCWEFFVGAWELLTGGGGSLGFGRMPWRPAVKVLPDPIAPFLADIAELADFAELSRTGGVDVRALAAFRRAMGEAPFGFAV